MSQLSAIDRLDRAICERSLAKFIRQGWKYIDPADYLHNWHIDAISELLQAVTEGQSRRAIINVPPRHMKSLQVAVAWPAWTWAQNPGTDEDGTPRYIRANSWAGPGTKFLFSSYSQSLSTRDSRKCRQLIQSPWYRDRWGDRVVLTDDQNQKQRFENTAQGYRLATSTTGTLTGEGGDIIVIDDPHNVLDAESDAMRTEVITWWDEAMSTRLNSPQRGAYVVVMQRVHEKDLVGHILAKEHGWDHLCLPARFEVNHPTPTKMRSPVLIENEARLAKIEDPRSEEGEVLWANRFDETSLKELEGKLNAYGTAGQLQQRPTPREGGLFKRVWFADKFLDKPLPAVRTVRSWDLAGTEVAPGKDPDWTAGLRMSLLFDGRFVIEHVERGRWSPGMAQTNIRTRASQDGPHITVTIPQDNGQAGKFQVSEYVKALAGYAVQIASTQGGKQNRADPLATQCEHGNVWLVRGDWNDAFLDELCTFPLGKHDDQVDAASDAFKNLAMVPTGPSIGSYGAR